GGHAVLRREASGLEEGGGQARADGDGRASVERERRDGWGWHAVAHVMEMQGRIGHGIDWLSGNSDAWSRESSFAVHNWWHLALFHLESGRVDEALALFDGPIDGHASPLAIDLVDATALLWRLHLRGVEIGSRWD